jgi:hypothetical protein
VVATRFIFEEGYLRLFWPAPIGRAIDSSLRNGKSSEIHRQKLNPTAHPNGGKPDARAGVFAHGLVGDNGVSRHNFTGVSL